MPGPNHDSPIYIVGFAAAVCFVCAIVVASASVTLKPRQEQNQLVARLSKVLTVAGLKSADEELSDKEVLSRFEKNITARVVDLDTGKYDDSVDAEVYNQRKAKTDPERSTKAPPNAARVTRLPNKALVYHVMRDGKVDGVILPIEGYGLWSTMYGYLALESDTRTVAGITFYEHGETPGLGGEIESPSWQERWPGRKVYDDSWNVELEVVKGSVGPPQQDPYKIDGLSGATITSRGVTNTLEFWFGEHGFGPYLENFRRGNLEKADAGSAMPKETELAARDPGMEVAQ